MGRKRKRGFEWIAEGGEGELIERVERRNRSAIKRERARMVELAATMIALSEGHRRQLSLDDETLAALDAACKTRHGTDQRRKLLYAAALLEGEDLDALEAEVKGMG